MQNASVSLSLSFVHLVHNNKSDIRYRRPFLLAWRVLDSACLFWSMDCCYDYFIVEEGQKGINSVLSLRLVVHHHKPCEIFQQHALTTQNRVVVLVH